MTRQTQGRTLTTVFQHATAAKGLAVAEMAVVTLAFAVFSKADAGIVDLVGLGGLERRWTLLGTYAAVLAFPVMQGSLAEVVRLAVSDRLLLGIAGLAALSTLWSPQPTATFGDVLSLGLTVAVAAHLASRFDLRTLAALLFAAMVAAAALGIVAVFARKGGLHILPPHGGTLRGLYIHKNILGQAVAAGAIPGTLLALDGLTRRRWWTVPAIAGQGLVIAVLWLADSRTAQVSLVVSLLVALGFGLLRRGPARLADAAGAVLGPATLALTWLLFAGVIEPISPLLGRTRSMLARLDIWSAVVEVLGRRYWLGFGFESFWLEGSPTRQAVETAVGWEVSMGHNGYIDIVLGIGLVGLLLFSVHLVRTCITSAQLAQGTRGLATLFPVMMVALIVSVNLAESNLLAPGTLLFVSYLVCSFWTSPKQGRYGQPGREMVPFERALSAEVS